MNIEHDEVVVQDVSDQIASDDALELAAGEVQGRTLSLELTPCL